MAHEVEAGQSPATALAHFRQLPATLEPLIDWALHTNSLNEAFEAAPRYLRSYPHQHPFHAALLPPVLFMMIGVAVEWP